MTSLLDKLDSLIAETERATPGPYRLERVDLDHGEIAYEVSKDYPDIGGFHVSFYESNCLDKRITAKHQAEFYASARTNYPAALRALKKAVERLGRIESHQTESIDKVVLLVNIEGYRQCAKEALAEIEKELGEK